MLGNKSPQELEAMEIASYKKLFDRIMPGKQDPYTFVTGKKLEDSRYTTELFGNTFSLETVFLPDVPLDFQNENETHATTASTEARIESNEDSHVSITLHNFFNPVFSLEKDDGTRHGSYYNLFFGFLIMKNSVTTAELIQGCFVLNPHIVTFLNKQGDAGTKIITSLQSIASIFNHDFIAHGTFLPTNNDQTTNEEIVNKVNQLDENGFDVDNLEFWSLNLHKTIAENVFSENPATKRWLRFEFSQYLNTLDNIISKNTHPDRELFREYLIKAYAFCFFRLINPKEFMTSDEFRELREKYPDLSNVSREEDNLRKEYIFENTGFPFLSNDGEETFVPHSQVLNQLEKIFKKDKDMGEEK